MTVEHRRYRWRLVSECPPGTARPPRKLQFLFDPINGFELGNVVLDDHLSLELVELHERSTGAAVASIWRLSAPPDQEHVAVNQLVLPEPVRLEPGQRLSVVCRTESEPGTCWLVGSGNLPPSARAAAVFEQGPDGSWLEVIGFSPRSVLLDELARLDPLDRLRAAAQAFYATDVAEPSPDELGQRERELDAALRAWIQTGGAS